MHKNNRINNIIYSESKRDIALDILKSKNVLSFKFKSAISGDPKRLVIISSLTLTIKPIDPLVFGENIYSFPNNGCRIFSGSIAETLPLATVTAAVINKNVLEIPLIALPAHGFKFVLNVHLLKQKSTFRGQIEL